jgi:uncharacterized protein YcaQ
VIETLGIVQIDFVNVLSPAHYLVPFSRLGPYDRRLFDRVVYGSGAFTERWAHEASIVPVSTWPLLRHRMATHRVRPWGFEAFMAKHPEYVEAVLEAVRMRGPLSADDLPDLPDGQPRRLPGDAWIGTIPRAVLEALFGRGVLSVVARRPDYARVFDLTERLVPAEHHGRDVAKDDAHRDLLRLAARAFGIATEDDLADYYRMRPREARPRIAELVEEGEVRPVRVEGWAETAYLHREARVPARVAARAIVSPFDPLVWFRPRALRLFGFDYRIEIYTPKEKRRWGYYVLPVLLGDRLAGRVDLKADRGARRLVARSAHVEEGAEPSAVAAGMAAELADVASWLGLEAVSVAGRRGFDRLLRAAL